MSETEFDALSFLNPLIRRMRRVGSREMEVEIAALSGAGPGIIPVHGYPVSPPPAHIYEAACDAAKSIFFPPSNGLRELRDSLARAIGAQYGCRIDPSSQILVTCGAMHALHVVFTSLLAPGDEVLLVSPCYFFRGLIEMAGGRPVWARAREESGYALDFDHIRSCISGKTKAVMLSSPVNPTGYVYSRKDVEEFLAIAEAHNLLIVSDESYDRLVYDGGEHISPFHYLEGRVRTVLVKSFTKSFGLPIWRVGYVAAEGPLIAQFRKVFEWTMLYCPYVNQRVALAALDGPQGWLEEISREFERGRDQLTAGISGAQGYTWIRPRGGPFIFLNVSRLSADCHRVAGRLLREYGIPVVSGKHFETRGHVRIPFGGSEEAVGRLVAAINQSSRDGLSGGSK